MEWRQTSCRPCSAQLPCIEISSTSAHTALAAWPSICSFFFWSGRGCFVSMGRSATDCFFLLLLEKPRDTLCHNLVAVQSLDCQLVTLHAARQSSFVNSELVPKSSKPLSIVATLTTKPTTATTTTTTGCSLSEPSSLRINRTRLPNPVNVGAQPKFAPQPTTNNPHVLASQSLTTCSLSCSRLTSTSSNGPHSSSKSVPHWAVLCGVPTKW
mmetsp:Transcript_46828/g.100851  ORF Transcript_46828/g.100851 Transcript_46828/m.100851 type:complete len:212 (+) Transcript_46828:1846-2481(+)